MTERSILASWLSWATADASARGLQGLTPLLESLARGAAALRAGSWNPDASGGDDRGGAGPPELPRG